MNEKVYDFTATINKVPDINGVCKDIRQKIGKEPEDTVHVTVKER